MKFRPIDVELMRSLFEYDPSVGGSCLVRKTDAIGANGGVRVKAGTKAGHQCGQEYWQVSVNGIRYLAHRIVWAVVYGEDPPCQVDHILGHEVGNHIENLRLAHNNNADNQQNAKRRKDNTSGYVGVSYHKSVDKWQGRIRDGGKQRHLGMFDTPEEAYEAYLKAKKELHEFQPEPREK